MSLAAAAWCVACGEAPTVAVTVERRETMMHYGSCWDHVAVVAQRTRLDCERIDRETATRSLTP